MVSTELKLLIRKELSDLEGEEFHEAWREIVSVMKSVRRVASEQALDNLEVGQNVTFKGRYGRTEYGVITKINRTTATVKTETTTWRVSPGLLAVVQ